MKYVILSIFVLLNVSLFSQTFCESFDDVTVPPANKQQAFNIYGNGNAGFLQEWFVASGTPSIHTAGDLSGVLPFSGNQYALHGVCDVGALWSEGLMLQFNFQQNQNYTISFAARNAPIGGSQPTPIDVDYILLQSIIPYTYNPSTGCSPTPGIPVGSQIVYSLTNFATNAWGVVNFNTGNLTTNYTYLWIRPRFSSGAPRITTALLTDSFCVNQLLCAPSVDLGNDTAICPGNSVTLNAFNQNATYLWNTGATTPSINVSAPGTYSVTVTGECGPQDIAIDSIEILGDVIAPTALCQDITIALSGNSASITANDVDGGSYDNCSLSLYAAPLIFDCSSLGNNLVVLTASDSSGNSSTCIATVTVEDTTDPTALCRDITVPLAGSTASITAADIDNGSYDNCTVSVSATSLSFDCSNLGLNTVTLTALDGSGNSSSCTSTVTITDTTAPVAMCKDTTLTLNGNSVGIHAADIDSGSYDNCSFTLSASGTFDCTDFGTNIVTLTATDGSGNSSSCDATVTITGGQSFSCSIASVLTPSTQLTGGNSTTIYLGYGPQSTTLISSVSTPDTYTYSWSPSADLDCATCASPLFTPTQEGLYNFTLTVTNSAGCSSTCTITICVLDIRVYGNCSTGNGNGGNSPGKVYVCHLPPGNPANVQTICIGVAGVPAHVPLHGGDYLGRCNQSCGSLKTDDPSTPELVSDDLGMFNLLVYPNPTQSIFNVQIESESSEPVTIKWYSITGQMISEVKSAIIHRTFAIGNEVVPGMYLLQITQGGSTKTIRLVKSE